MNRKYLFYVNQNYSFEILRPLQAEILSNGDTVKWFSQGREINNALFSDDEDRIKDIKSLIAYQPDACFVPGNEIPSFISGLKVQVFHGLEWKKKGHFVIRGFFDLYCTHGPATTSRFNKLAEQHGYFDVIETGWPKLDNLFSTKPFQDCPDDKKVILYAPTFSPSLTSAPALLSQISNLIQESKYHWLIKFHPKMSPEWKRDYEDICNEHCQIVETSNINEVLQRADIMISDTSSVIGEFSLLGKPVVTLNNSEPGDYLIDIKNPNELSEAIAQAFTPDQKLLKAIKTYADDLHPNLDGSSSSKILEAVNTTLMQGKKHKNRKPLNLLRNFKMRKKLNYWGK